MKPETKYIIRNSIRTPDGTELISKSTHDYVYYKDKNGKMYSVDGGYEYLKRGYESQDFEETSIYSTDDIGIIRDVFKWGTYGKDGQQDLSYILLKDMSNEHISNILKTQTYILLYVQNIFSRELETRRIK